MQAVNKMKKLILYIGVTFLIANFVHAVEFRG